MNEDKSVVYTAITGGKNSLLQHDHPDPAVDYICFSDTPIEKPGVWKIHPISKSMLECFTGQNGQRDNTRIAKVYKLQPHTFPQLSESENSLWVDGSIRLKMKNISTFMKNMLLGTSGFRVFSNPLRNSVREEVDYCILHQKDDATVLKQQLRAYYTEGFPDVSGLINGSFILRRTHENNVVAFNTLWWDEILKHSKRDEVSFPYLAWLHEFDFALFPWPSRYDCPLIEVKSHHK
ncbi:MAG: glycosyltransferase domain-containing protein [Microgenomates group bacterium]